MTINDVLLTKIKGTWGTDFSDSENGVAVIKTNNLSYEGEIDFTDICYRNIDKEKAKKLYLQNGDLLVEKSGGTRTHTVGYVNYFANKNDYFVCNNFILALRPDSEKIFPKYLFWQMRCMYETGRFSDCYNKTTGIQNLKDDFYLSKKIIVPPKDQQQKIAAYLDKITESINNKKKQLAFFDELVKSKFVEMFGTYPANQKNWETGTIRDVVIDVHYGTSRPAVEGGAYKYIRMNNITYEGYLDLSDIKYINIPDNELEKCTVKKGDVLFNRTNSPDLVGKTCVYNLDETMILAGFIIRVRTNDKVLPNFLSAFLNTDFSKEMLKGKCKKAVNQANINAQEMQNIGIYIPPIHLQNQFAEFVQKCDHAKSAVKQEIVCLQELLDSKMQDFFGNV